MQRSNRRLAAVIGLAFAAQGASAQCIPAQEARFGPYTWAGNTDPASLDAFEDRVAVGIRGAVSGAGEVHVFRRDGAVWSVEASIRPADGVQSDNFGSDVAIYADRMLVGASGDDDRGDAAGSAYVYRRTGNAWSFEAKLLSNDVVAYDNFGAAVALTADQALVAGPSNFGGLTRGLVVVYTLEGGQWNQTSVIQPAPANTTEVRFGHSVTVQNGLMVISTGTTADNSFLNGGRAYVYGRSGNTWAAIQQLTTADNAQFWTSRSAVDGSGATIAIGVGVTDTVYTFEHLPQGWVEQSRINRTPLNGAFGAAVAFRGSRLYVGAPNDQSPGTTMIFTHPGSEWLLDQSIDIMSDPAAVRGLGGSIAIAGDTLALGARISTGSPNRLLAYFFDLTIPFAGDADSDLVVNFADITSVLANFGAVYGAPSTGPGDADKNGTVEFADISSVLANFGFACN